MPVDIEHLYSIFADEQQPAGMIGSSRRYTRTVFDALTSAPLRELTADSLGPYASHAMTTMGTARDYRHFLPRILELSLVSGSWIGIDPEVIADKLVYGDWRKWSDSQAQGLTGFFYSAFGDSLQTQDPLRSAPHSWLAALARLDLDIAPCLADWRKAKTPLAACALADFVTDWTRDREESVPPYWGDVSIAKARMVGDWVLSSETASQLRMALSEITDEEGVCKIEYGLAELARSGAVTH